MPTAEIFACVRQRDRGGHQWMPSLPEKSSPPRILIGHRWMPSLPEKSPPPRNTEGISGCPPYQSRAHRRDRGGHQPTAEIFGCFRQRDYGGHQSRCPPYLRKACLRNCGRYWCDYLVGWAHTCAHRRDFRVFPPPRNTEGIGGCPPYQSRARRQDFQVFPPL